MFTKEGVRVRTIGENGEGNGQFRSPTGVAVEPGPEGRLYVADNSNQRVQVLTKTGEHVRTIGVTGRWGKGNHRLSHPYAVAAEPGPDGLLYVADSENWRVLVFVK